MRGRAAVPGAGLPILLTSACLLLLGACVGSGATAPVSVPVVPHSASPRSAPTAPPSPDVPTAQPSLDAADDAEAAADAAWARAKAVIDEYYWVLPNDDDDIPARQERAAAVWAEALATVCPPEGVVSCSPDTFGPAGWTFGVVNTLDTSLEVVGGDPAQLRAALDASSVRFLLIDTEGREWSRDDLDEAQMAAWSVDDEIFTPTYASYIEETDGAMGFWFDVEGNLYPDMARAQIGVLLEELDRAGVSEARIRPLTGFP